MTFIYVIIFLVNCWIIFLGCIWVSKPSHVVTTCICHNCVKFHCIRAQTKKISILVLFSSHGKSRSDITSFVCVPLSKLGWTTNLSHKKTYREGTLVCLACDAPMGAYVPHLRVGAPRAWALSLLWKLVNTNH